MINERMRVYGHLYRARLIGTLATLTLTEWKKTLEDFKGMCAYCGAQPFTVLEHFVPVAVAGTHVKNCVPACELCNNKKRDYTGDKLVDIFGDEAINRIATYLESRVEMPDPPDENKRRYWFTNPKRGPFRVKSGEPYKTISQAAEELGYHQNTVKKWMRELGMKSHRFPRKRNLFISTVDAKILKMLKSKALEGQR